MAGKYVICSTFGFSSTAGGGVPSPTILQEQSDAPAGCPRAPGVQRWRQILCW